MSLLPCPFCGCDTNEFRLCRPFGDYQFSCECGARGPVVKADYFPDLRFEELWEKAIAAWNRRVTTWQPIETAPKDGTRISLAKIGGPVWNDCRWQKMTRTADRWQSFVGALPFEPTHWMALPPPPEPPKGGGE